MLEKYSENQGKCKKYSENQDNVNERKRWKDQWRAGKSAKTTLKKRKSVGNWWTKIQQFTDLLPPPGFESSGRSVENARKMYCDECKWRTLKARGLEKWSDHGTE